MKTNSYSEARGYNLDMAREHGLSVAVVYNQLLFWQSTKKPEEFFYKTFEEMVRELPLSERSIRNCYTKLKKAGLIETKVKKVNGDRALHVRCRLQTANSAGSIETANSAGSIYRNNKVPIKHKKDPAQSAGSAADLEKLYRLYLSRFVVKYINNRDNLNNKELIEKASRKYKLTKTRREALRRRIKDAGFNMVAAAIVGYSTDDFYSGNNDRGWKASLEFICRSYEKIEEGANKYAASNRKNVNDPWSE